MQNRWKRACAAGAAACLVCAAGWPASAAGLFCAKEAVAKALGVGLYGLLPREIEIFHSPAGEPQVRLLGQAALRFPQVQLRVSISHTKTLATATALARVRVR